MCGFGAVQPHDLVSNYRYVTARCLLVQRGDRSIQVTVIDRGPFKGAFLDLSPAAASALGCRCTHRDVTATVVQLGSGGRSSPAEVANVPSLRQPCRCSSSRPGTYATDGNFGSTMTMAPAPRHRGRQIFPHYASFDLNSTGGIHGNPRFRRSRKLCGPSLWQSAVLTRDGGEGSNPLARSNSFQKLCRGGIRRAVKGAVPALQHAAAKSCKSPFVFTSERGSPFTTAGFARMVERAGVEARLGFPAHPHMLRHACGFALANKGHDTRALQAYLGHRNIQHTVRYTELSPGRFKDFWR
jgi:hypothetical protein